MHFKEVAVLQKCFVQEIVNLVSQEIWIWILLPRRKTLYPGLLKPFPCKNNIYFIQVLSRLYSCIYKYSVLNLKIAHVVGCRHVIIPPQPPSVSRYTLHTNFFDFLVLCIFSSNKLLIASSFTLLLEFSFLFLRCLRFCIHQTLYVLFPRLFHSPNALIDSSQPHLYRTLFYKCLQMHVNALIHSTIPVLSASLLSSFFPLHIIPLSLPLHLIVKIGPQSEHVGTSWFLLSILELIRSQREQSIKR